MAEPTAQTLILAIGQSKLITITMDVPPDGGVGAWAVEFRLRRTGFDVLIDKTLSDGVVLVDAVNGIWAITIVGADTEILQEIQYTWSFWRTDVNTEAPIAFGYTTPYLTAQIG
jgi:hypothetical protein